MGRIVNGVISAANVGKSGAALVNEGGKVRDAIEFGAELDPTVA